MDSSSSIGSLGTDALESSQPAVPINPKVLVAAAAKLNAANAAGADNEIVITMNDHRMVIQIVSRESREIVQQISPPSLLRMFKKLPQA
jgi:phenolic acid decarboxylase